MSRRTVTVGIGVVVVGGLVGLLLSLALRSAPSSAAGQMGVSPVGGDVGFPPGADRGDAPGAGSVGDARRSGAVRGDRGGPAQRSPLAVGAPRTSGMGGPRAASGWEDLPIGNGSNLGALAAPFQAALMQGSWGQGIRDNCGYGLEPAPARRPDPTVLILDLETAGDSLCVVGATVEHAGSADEYQQRCLTGWFEKIVVETPGVTQGKRFRVRYPVKL